MDSTGEVPAGAWYHVAVSYDGTTALFYIDGIPAGEAALANTGTDSVTNLSIGANVDGRYSFQGYIDELRIWSGYRRHAEIQANMYRELLEVEGRSTLRGVFRGGLFQEIVNGREGNLMGDVNGSPFGILPRELTVPRAAVTPSGA